MIPNLPKPVEEVYGPVGNVYYENSSADGFAFQGFARAKTGLDYSRYLRAIIDRNFSLNKSQKIKRTGISVPKDNQYIYTIWTCIEFLREIGEIDAINSLMNIVNNIGTYPDGVMRYCSSEIKYKVPNTTSAAALLYAWNDEESKSIALVDVMRKTQSRGNWRYRAKKGKKWIPSKEEDNFHLAMIIYHLRSIEKYSGVQTHDIVEKALERLKSYNKEGIKVGRIKWAIPMVYAATCGLDHNLEETSFKELVDIAIKDDNFRVRGMSAWALTRWL